jgi:hypothetical protein
VQCIYSYVICEILLYIIHSYVFCVIYVYFVLHRFVILICAAMPCLNTTPYGVDYVAVLSMCGDYECTVWLVPFFNKGTVVCAAIKARG